MTKKICKKAGFRDDSSLLRYSSSKNPVAKKARHDEDINDENSHSKNVDLNKADEGLQLLKEEVMKLQTTNAQIKDSNAEIAKLHAKIYDKAEENFKLRGENESLNAQIKAQTKEFDAEIAKLNVKISEKPKENVKLQGENETLNAQINAQAKEFDAKIDKLQLVGMACFTAVPHHSWGEP